MSMDSIDEERLQKLLGGAELANLRLRLRARYERGTSRDEFALTDLEACERRALAGLLGRRTLAADSMRIRRSELDEALARAGIAGTLREALEFLDGPLSDRRADRIAREHAWNAALARTAEPRLAKLLADAAGAALVKRLSGSDASRSAADASRLRTGPVAGARHFTGTTRGRGSGRLARPRHGASGSNHRVAGVRSRTF